MPLHIDTQKLQGLIQGLSDDLTDICETSEVPIYEYQNEFGETCQLKLVATKEEERLIVGGESFYCLSPTHD